MQAKTAHFVAVREGPNRGFVANLFSCIWLATDRFAASAHDAAAESWPGTINYNARDFYMEPWVYGPDASAPWELTLFRGIRVRRQPREPIPPESFTPRFHLGDTTKPYQTMS